MIFDHPTAGALANHIVTLLSAKSDQGSHSQPRWLQSEFAGGEKDRNVQGEEGALLSALESLEQILGSAK